MRAKVVIENDWLSRCVKFVIASDLVHLFTSRNQIRLLSFPVLVLSDRMVADSIVSDL